MNELEVFKFQGADIRVIEHEGRQVAYMPDVAQVFGLRPNNVIPTLDPWDYVELAAENSAAALGRTDVQRVSPYWLTESGINHLSYKLSPELRRAVNEEILPALRKTGTVTVRPSGRRRPEAVEEAQYKARLARELERKLGLVDAKGNYIRGMYIDRETLKPVVIPGTLLESEVKREAREILFGEMKSMKRIAGKVEDSSNATPAEQRKWADFQQELGED